MTRKRDFREMIHGKKVFSINSVLILMFSNHDDENGIFFVHAKLLWKERFLKAKLYYSGLNLFNFNLFMTFLPWKQNFSKLTLIDPGNILLGQFYDYSYSSSGRREYTEYNFPKEHNSSFSINLKTLPNFAIPLILGKVYSIDSAIRAEWTE